MSHRKNRPMKALTASLILSSMLLPTLSGCTQTPPTPGSTTIAGGSTVNTDSSSTIPKPTSGLTPDALFEAFQNPDKHLNTKPLFFWNIPLKDMTTDQVRELVRKSYEESGYDGFGILPYWLDGYMTDEYFELYEAALDEGSKYGMQFSLYDEDGFPSYTAGGLFAEKYPELTARRLDMVEGSGRAGDKVFVQIPSGTFMGAVAINLATGERYNISELAHLVEGDGFDIDAQPLGALASSTYDIAPGYEVDKAFDGDRSTRWNAYQHSGSRAWIQINYGKTVEIDKVEIFEDKLEELQRIRAFELQIWQDGKWTTVADGDTITDKGVSFTFDSPIKAQYVRLFLRKVTGDSATISEFNLSYKGKQIAIPESPDVEQEELTPGYYASSNYSAEYDAGKAFDGDKNTRWNSQNGHSVGEWLMAYYEKTVTLDSLTVSEHLDRISAYKVEYLDGDVWKSCAEGTTIGSSKEITFPAIKTKGIRLVMSTSNGDLPTIFEVAPKYKGKTVLPEAGATVNDYSRSYIEYEIPANAGGDWKVLCFVCVNEYKEGMDYLNPEAVKGYIEITHEAYYQRFKKYFDNGTITSSFYDEPSFYPAGGLTAYGVEGARMWTDGLNDFFKTMYPDEDPLLLYPALWYDIGEDTNAARDKLYGVRSEMFAKNYIGQINDWCTEHGIKLMGHMLFEEWVNPLCSEGDLMLCFKYQEIPGVDCIGHYGYSQEAYKVISSSAFNWDKQLVMSETFGAMSADMPASMLYRQTIDLYTKGINLIVPHAIWYSDTQNVVYPPELSYRNPKYAEVLPEYNQYTARLSSILQKEGVHVADIAMLYPIDYLESVYYFNGQQNNPADANYMQIGEYLSLTARRDFTYLHPEVLDACKLEDGKLVIDNKVNREQFRVFLVPGMKVISLSNLEKIYEFWKAGNPVIFVGTIPTEGISADEKGRITEILTEMLGKAPNTVSGSYEYLEGAGRSYHVNAANDLDSVLDRALEVWDVSLSASTRQRNGYLSYIHKQVDGREVYYIGNSADNKTDVLVKLRGEFRNLELWNPADGTRTPLKTQVKDGVTTLKISLEGISSAFIVECGEE